MNSEWQKFLLEQGAVLERGVISAYSGAKQGVEKNQLLNQQVASDAAAALGMAQGTATLIALLDLGVICVSGEDACTFLQAHFCNDVASLSAGEAQLSGYCNPKGRLLAVFYLVRQGGDYLLVLPRDTIDAVLNRLNMFARMARPVGKQLIGKVTTTAVSLHDVSDERVVIGYQSSAPTSFLDDLPIAHFPVLSAAEQPQRYLAVGKVEAVIKAWEQLRPGSSLITAEQWRLTDIRAGSPRVVKATQEAFVPQMTNMHLLEGVSFTKGCYPGQEIVARMQYLGKLKRRMERFSVCDSSQGFIEAGTPIVGSNDVEAGVVVQAAGSNADRTAFELLAVMKISELDGRPLHLGGAQGPVLERLAMPYVVQESATESHKSKG